MSATATLQSVLDEELARWPADEAAVAVVDDRGLRSFAGSERSFPWASVTKLLSALTVLRATHEGTVSLDDPAGPPGSTLRHLLAHSSGLSFDSDRVLSEPGRRRIYSNRGTELAAEHVADRVGRPFEALLAEWVLDPLGMSATSLAGSPAHGASGPVRDLALLAHELLCPGRLPASVVATATAPSFPSLAGVLPGFGRQAPNDWGLGPELRGAKAPHWTSPSNSPSTFGHFGQSGSFLWVDPEARAACVAAADTPFGPWASEAWPRLSTRVLRAQGAGSSTSETRSSPS